MKEASLYERGDRPGLERASIQKLKYKLDSGNNLLGDEVSKQKEVMRLSFDRCHCSRCPNQYSNASFFLRGRRRYAGCSKKEAED